MMAMSATASEGGWRAALALVLSRRGMGTRLTSRSGSGPLVVQRPLYPEGPRVCHLYVLHPPGGVAGGDSLQLSCTLEAGAQALLTTPAAGKFYRSGGRCAGQEQALRVAAGAALEWLPQDNIFFAGSDVRLDTRVELETGARFLGWEIGCLGRPASGDHYRGGRLIQRTQLWRGGQPLLLECNRIGADEPVMRAPWGLGGFSVMGALYATPAGDGHLSLAREALAGAGIERGGVTLVNDVLVARCLTRDAELCRRAMTAVWKALREALLGPAPCPPRIWKT